ncbi:DUF4197 domain-containing protein [Paludibacter sp. 221]|uniref:DUF4197 domain-containing protein n=1 Tax=Paludibacter sp. 221 TaxID=2302939 RepID=UPI0013D8560C|nr:DUF4197 domain-containing protein [Paludibacter sp. 221]NDV46046.1 DUF4197 domain-containing protein [Paludibacter sp. 221]
MKKFIFVFISLFVLNACEQIQKTFDNVAGLKEALTIGSKTASTLLGTENGYLLDSAVKILLPEQAQTALNAIKTVQGYTSNPAVSGLIKAVGLDIPTDFSEVLTTAINRSAEDAAPKAAGIFANTIKNINILDAASLLFSPNKTAATDYLEKNTYSDLQGTFGSVISESLSKIAVGIGGSSSSSPAKSATASLNVLEAWDYFTTQNNNVVSYLDNNPLIKTVVVALVPEAANIKTIETDLGAYVTGKALDGLFLKVGEQETKIRTDASARTSELLQDVFGQLDN